MSCEKRKFECTALPKGWQREEVPRKTGLSAGKIDVYYYSPDGKKFRSKPQLARYLGNTLDLATFDFRSGKVNSLLMRKNKKQRGTQFDYRSMSLTDAESSQGSETTDDRLSETSTPSPVKSEPEAELNVAHRLQHNHHNQCSSMHNSSTENQYKVAMYCDSESGSVKTFTMLRSVESEARPRNLINFLRSVGVNQNVEEIPVCSYL
ncbi:methyl-CpG-binding domain protein 4 isoform X3 [Bacillus rossius redtenbacheri]|uniref:methyl-CpG-binding domain protein 4 isoform X3 n=1 Tax=Bacillus rossius redtenbacheri TaxID=93214 RepID=UPI002FDE42D9